jgi:hypothetical protein
VRTNDALKSKIINKIKPTYTHQKVINILSCSLVGAAAFIIIIIIIVYIPQKVHYQVPKFNSVKDTSDRHLTLKT